MEMLISEQGWINEQAKAFFEGGSVEVHVLKFTCDTASKLYSTYDLSRFYKILIKEA